MKDSYETPKPVLVMVRGLPGSGKSYLAVELQKQIGHDAVVLLDPDATDYTSEEYSSFSSELSAQGVDSKLHPYRYLRSNAYNGIVSGKIIIWNQAFTNQDLLDRTINNLKTFAQEHNIELPTLIVEVEIDSDIAKNRIATREAKGGHGVSADAFARFVTDYSSFSDSNYNIIVIDGAANVEKSANQLAAEIESLRKI